MSDDRQTTQIVAAILAGHAASKADRMKATSYFDKYIAVIQELKGRENEINDALNGPKPKSVSELL